MLPNRFTLVIHGGAGIISKARMTPQLQFQYRSSLLESLKLGQLVLQNNGSALDAVEAAVIVLENAPCFNAGKGSVFSARGINQMDASIMEGKNRRAGAVTGTTKIKNPISAARKVMQKTKHVMLSGTGAQQFASEQGLELCPPQYFYFQKRFQQFKAAQREEVCILDHSDPPKLKQQFNAEFVPNSQKSQNKQLENNNQKEEKKFGTVGAVAIDVNGNMAAATSTGGMTNKKWGRIGDSPIIGAGCYANNKTCAVSSTGEGQFFIRGVVAYQISAMMQFGKLSLEQASKKVIYQRLVELGGTGGVIAVDKDHNISMPFNTNGMYRGFVTDSKQKQVFIYKL